MDRVECTTVFESYSYNVGKVRLFWKRHGVPVEIIGDINLPDFIMTHYVHEKATFQYPVGGWDQVSSLYFKRFFQNQSHLQVFFEWHQTQGKQILLAA